MLLWPNIYCKKHINKKCIPFLCNMHECPRAPTPTNVIFFINNGLENLDFYAPTRFLKFNMHLTSFNSSLNIWPIGSCVSPTMLVIVASQSKGSYLGDSKWKLLVCQSTCGLCKMNQDNPMMIGFFKDKMTLNMALNMTLIECDSMVVSNALVSCVTSLEEKLWLSLTSTPIDVIFFNKVNLCCCTNSLSTKHVNALESSNVWIFIIMDLLHLTMTHNKKLNVGS